MPSLSYLLTSHFNLDSFQRPFPGDVSREISRERPKKEKDKKRRICLHLCHYTVFFLREEEKGAGNEVGLHPHRSQLPTNQRARFRSVVVTSVMFLQLFRERLSEKVHATILKGIVGGFKFSVLQRNLKELARKATEMCFRRLEESNKSRFDSYSSQELQGGKT